MAEPQPDWFSPRLAKPDRPGRVTVVRLATPGAPVRAWICDRCSNLNDLDRSQPVLCPCQSEANPGCRARAAKRLNQAVARAKTRRQRGAP